MLRHIDDYIQKKFCKSIDRERNIVLHVSVRVRTIYQKEVGQPLRGNVNLFFLQCPLHISSVVNKRYFSGPCELLTYDSVRRIRFIFQCKDVRRSVL